MTTYFLISAPILVGLAAIFAGLGAMLARSRYPTGARPAGLAMLAVAVWLLGAAGEVLTTGSPTLYSLVRAAKYVGVAAVGPIYLVFVLQYAYDVAVTRKLAAALFAVPAATALLVWTNPLHELMWQVPFPPLGRGEWGVWFLWVHTPYSYGTILAGTGGLIVEMIRGSTLRRAQSSLLAVGALFPLAVNAVYLANPQIPDLNQTPLSFGVTAGIFAWGFFRLHLFKVSPLALRAAVDAVDDAVLVVDQSGRIADFNPAARRLLDPRLRREPLGQPLASALAEAGIDGATLEDRARGDSRTPEGVWLETNVRAIRDRHRGEVRGWIVVVRDVSDQRRAEQALRESEAIMRSVLERSPIGIVRLTPLVERGRVRDFTVVLANPTATATLADGGRPLMGRRLTEVRPPHTPLLLDMLRRVIGTGQPEEAVVRVDRSGETEGAPAGPRWYRIDAVAVGDDVAVTFVDITAERLRRQELTTAAHTDPLTGLLNRRGLDKDGNRLVRSARRDGRPAGLLFLDLDDFKEINDRFGHDIGDLALRQFAGRVQAVLRAEDVLARVGGDEFVVLVQDPGAGTLEDVIGRVHEACEEPLPLPDRGDGAPTSLRLSCSIGSARVPEDGHDLADLMQAADRAMYRSKERGPIAAGDPGQPPAPGVAQS